MKLGIDIGGTNISLGLVEDGKLIQSEHIPSFEKEWTMERTVRYLSDKISEIVSKETESIGIGVPSVVDVRNGIVYDTVNIPSWKEIHLKEILEERFRLPVCVNNDANCYALGAYTACCGREKPESLVAMTLGTGVGMGIVLDGKLFCGANCGAGELSCLPFKDSTIEDHCCKNFFLRAGTTPLDAYNAAMKGESAAISLFEEFGRNLGYAVCAILYSYDPECVVIGGGISGSAAMFKSVVEDYVKNNFLYHKTAERLRLEIMADGDLPVIGAASLV